MFFVLLCFFKGLDPDNLKRAARIKKNGNNSYNNEVINYHSAEDNTKTGY
jgi:hypothetical protein